jgi:gliding motility-associated-like protein
MRDFIPQGFSPNGDAWNNKFIIEGLNLDTETAELQILNGAGTVVYTTSNRNEQVWADWDGRNDRGNELPEGTYYYLLKVITQTNQTIKKSGFVVLKRY